MDLETHAVTASFPLAAGVTALAVGPDGKRVYAGGNSADRVVVSVLDVPAERVGTIDIGCAPAANIDALCVDARGKRLCVGVTDDRGSQLLVVDAETARTRAVVPVGSPIRDVACAGDAIYVLTSDRAVGGAVHVVDPSTTKVIDTVTVGDAPTRMSLSPDEARVYVVDYDRVVVLDTLSLDVVDALTGQARPSCVAHGPDGSRLYIADYAGAVSVFSVESNIEVLYAQFLATNPIALSVPRELQPVSA